MEISGQVLMKSESKKSQNKKKSKPWKIYPWVGLKKKEDGERIAISREYFIFTCILKFSDSP